MAKVTPENLEAKHVRCARALLNLSTREFAIYASKSLTFSKVHNFENKELGSEETRDALITAIENAGIKLLNGGKPGAQVDDIGKLKKARKRAGKKS